MGFMLRLVVRLSVVFGSACALAETHWAFQPLKPGQEQSIDAYIHHRLRREKLSPSPRADARTLIRRATFDLTGLPPTAEEVAAFERDDSPQAYAALIDRLLSSPHHGEHWARHWLDVARYSDTKGYVYAREEKKWVHAAPYRDWVVRALNEDMPYDRFLKLQIAADQLVPPKSPDLAAMGFLTLGRRFLGVTHDIIDDRIDVLTRGALGLTVSCSRCHDHKFDPIPTADYYALYGVFQSCAEALVPLGDQAPSEELLQLQRRNRELMTKRREEQMARNRARLSDYLAAQNHLEDYPEEVFSQLLDEKDLNPFIVHRWKAWLEKNPGVQITDAMMRQPDSPAFVPDEHIANIEMYFPTAVTTELWKAQGEVDRFLLKNPSAPAHATVLLDRTQPSAPRVFIRGSPLNKGQHVPRQFLSAFGPQQPFTKGSGRLELAEAIADARNPLTARVMVNRLWQHHFGRGLVSTPSDFGKQGSPPTHPELLDWLAQRFIDSSWSMKAMHRLIMLSQTYQQRSQVSTGAERDPDNHLLWRMSPHRLTFEEARDAWLTAAGQLNLRLGGQPELLFSPAHFRRTLYTLIDRENLPAVMRTFDFANPDLSIPQRSETTVPQQALFGMNHPFIVEQARALLNRPEAKVDSGMNRLQFIYKELFQRPPSHKERKLALQFVLRDQATSAALAQADHSSSWHYGYGEWDESTGRIKEFKPLPHFTGAAWQGDEAWPNQALGWAQLTATGGHPGNDRQHAVVRRWVAPTGGTFAVKSTLLHEPAAGDGIRSFISHSRQGRLHAGRLHQGSADLNFDSLTFLAGDTLDFVVDIDEVLNSDQFLWSIRIAPSGPALAGAEAAAWDSERDFSAQPGSQLNPWEQLVQVLMLTNEFMFVD